MKKYRVPTALVIVGATLIIIGAIRQMDLIIARLKLAVETLQDPFLLVGAFMLVAAQVVVLIQEK